MEFRVLAETQRGLHIQQWALPSADDYAPSRSRCWPCGTAHLAADDGEVTLCAEAVIRFVPVDGVHPRTRTCRGAGCVERP